MKIVVLDGYALNPGDLNWEPLEKLGELTVYDRTPPDMVVPRAAEAEVLLINKITLDEKIIDQLPHLQYIGVLATGYNIIDLAAARRKKIPVTNIPGYSTLSVAQMVFALLLEMTQQVGHHSRLVREEGRWSDCPDFCFWDRPLRELGGLKMGLVGFGSIGRRVAGVARAFGMDLLVHTAHPEKYRNSPEADGVRFCGLDELFAESDVLSLHCPLNDETEKMVNVRRLALMKPMALLINTARGQLLDEQAVADALNQGRLAGLGADVLAAEPPSAENPLLSASNAIVTPHIAWATIEARARLVDIAAENIRAFQGGRKENVVNEATNTADIDRNRKP